MTTGQVNVVDGVKLRALVEKWRAEAHALSVEGFNASANSVAGFADELQAALDAQAGGWLPIESAPRDGTVYLAYCGNDSIQSMNQPSDMHSIGMWEKLGARWGGKAALYAPTHWMPLPAGPVEGGEG